MSIPPKFLSKILRGQCARTRKIFQVRANMMIKKKSIIKFCCYDQKQQLSFFSHLLFFVAICCRNKKMLPKCCPTLNKHFLLRKFFSKSVSNVSKSKNVTLVTGGGNFDTTYVFASYTLQIPVSNTSINFHAQNLFLKAINLPQSLMLPKFRKNQ